MPGYAVPVFITICLIGAYVWFSNTMPPDAHA